ncbi:adenylyltransferase [Candidatus Bathyarchaeota archaeon]|nr:MAG: adenylyltransferase [Candidatus Bathyarchaeota archaeon]
MSLSPSELERYSRQLSIRGFGVKGQKKLKNSKVVVVGVGGLGCLSSLYLAAAGVGRIVLVDKGRFTLKNLNRQVLCWQKDIGRFKAEVAKEKLEEFNPEIKVETVIEEITEESVQEIIGKTDVVVDGMDNWKTRFIVNKYCVKQHIPFVHAGVSEMHGQITTIMPGEGPCLRCIFPRNPPEVENIPILGATPAFFAALQVIETVKLITGFGEPLVGRMLFVDGREMAVEIVKMKRNANCPVCGSL